MVPDLVSQGQIRWFDFGRGRGSEPSGQRPTLVVQGDALNHSRWSTTLVAPITTNLALGSVPGSVALASPQAGLTHDSVILLTALSTVNKSSLGPSIGMVSGAVWLDVLRALDVIVGRAALAS